MKHVCFEIKLRKNLEIFDSSYFLGKSHFKENGTQNYLVFQPINRYFKRIIDVGNCGYIHFWKSKGFSDERIDSITKSNYSVIHSLDYLGTKIRVKLNGCRLKQDKITYTHGKILNIYTVYEIKKNYPIGSYPTFENCFVWAVSLNENVDIGE